MDNKLSVQRDDGSYIDIDVVDIVELSDENKKYIFYTIGKQEDDKMKVYASILNETEDSYSLDTIEDEEEWKKVQLILDEMDSSLLEGIL